ncbi:MAG: hypothetical protein AB7O24_18010 [Kofleriaceae bacterium]
MLIVAGWILLAFGALLSTLTWVCVVNRYMAGSGSSVVPLFGGVFGFVGCALVPAIGWKLGVLAIAVDPGCGLLLVAGPILWLDELFLQATATMRIGGA